MSDLLFVGKILTVISGITGILWGLIKLIWGVSFTSRISLIEGKAGGFIPLIFGILLIASYIELNQKRIKHYITGALITVFAFCSGCYLGLIGGPLIIIDYFVEKNKFSVEVNNHHETAA